MVKLVIAGDPNKCSWNQRLHWRTRAARNAAWKMNAWAAWHAAGSPWVGEKVRVSFVVRRGRSLDSDNLHSSAIKAIIDGLKEKAFPDDDAAHMVMGELRQEPGKAYRLCPEVEVWLEEEPVAGSQ